MPRGGARPGSGRPRGAISEQTRIAWEIRAALIKRVQEESGGLMDAIVDLAKGVVVVKKNELTGEPTVYRKPPNVKAIQELLDRTLGKSVQPIDLGDGETLETLSDVLEAIRNAPETEEVKTPAKRIKTFKKAK